MQKIFVKNKLFSGVKIPFLSIPQKFNGSISCIIQPTGEGYGGLYLGDLYGAEDKKQLLHLRIRAVLTVAN